MKNKVNNVYFIQYNTIKKGKKAFYVNIVSFFNKIM